MKKETKNERGRRGKESLSLKRKLTKETLSLERNVWLGREASPGKVGKINSRGFEMKRVFIVCPVCGQVRVIPRLQKIEFLFFYPELLYQIVINFKKWGVQR